MGNTKHRLPGTVLVVGLVTLALLVSSVGSCAKPTPSPSPKPPPPTTQATTKPTASPKATVASPEPSAKPSPKPTAAGGTTGTAGVTATPKPAVKRNVYAITLSYTAKNESSFSKPADAYTPGYRIAEVATISTTVNFRETVLPLVDKSEFKTDGEGEFQYSGSYDRVSSNPMSDRYSFTGKYSYTMYGRYDAGAGGIRLAIWGWPGSDGSTYIGPESNVTKSAKYSGRAPNVNYVAREVGKEFTPARTADQLLNLKARYPEPYVTFWSKDGAMWKRLFNPAGDTASFSGGYSWPQQQSLFATAESYSGTITLKLVRVE